MEKDKVTLLEEVIRQFNVTSAELEKSYRLLEAQARQLKDELEVKNKALQESAIEQERLREQAHRNDRLAAVGEMAVRMAHELRNPLGSIELFVSLLKEGRASDSDKEKWIGHIQTGIDAMDYALSNLLVFTGRPNPNFKVTSIKKVIEEAACFATHLLQQKEVHFIQSVDETVAPLSCDEDLLKQAFVNLIINAVEAIHKGGQLKITAMDGIVDVRRHDGVKSEPGVIVKIDDNGCGIPKDRLSKIFDPFFSTKNMGTGLGLAIVHNAITAHNGTIEVTSMVEGREGTCFTVCLPQEP
jgi:signal transduction histidine kinase